VSPLPAFHRHPWFTGVWCITYALWFLPEIFLSRRLRSKQDARKADRGSMPVVILSVWLGIVLGFAVASRTPFSMGRLWQPAFALGISIWFAGIWVRLYSIRVLGQFFTFDVAVSTGHAVVERGLYRWIRHPSYLGGLLAMLGLGLTLSNWLALLLPACCLACAYAYRIPIEEKALLQGLGEDYRSYMRRTWRLVPYLF
jgi:protein-S-isoprenylcysteine O-methyltransferase Ste14